MNPQVPPKVARWLLSHFGCSPNNDAVIGDLDERYRQGRSRTWYCKQVGQALLFAWLDEIRAHKLSTLSVLVISDLHLFTTAVVFGYLSRGAINPLTGYAFTNVLPYNWWTHNSIFWIVDLLLTWAPLLLISMFTGWFIARIYGHHGRAMVITCLVFTCFAVAPPFYRMLLRPKGEPIYFNIRGLVIPLETVLAISLGGGLLNRRTQHLPAQQG